MLRRLFGHFGKSVGDSTTTVPDPMPDRIGRFAVRGYLGAGACGHVFLGFDQELRRSVAIKTPSRPGRDTDLREQFFHEARATATIDHPNVCPVYEVGTTNELPYIALRRVVGGNLAQLLNCLEAPLTAWQAAVITRQLARGLTAAHDQGVTHLDLKPQNVLCDMVRGRVLLTDFGLAQIGDEAPRTAAGKVFGTPAYMSPEQARGKVEMIGPASDVYSLGVTLYRLLTGIVPFHGTVYEVMLQHCEESPRAPTAVWPDVDPRLNALCLKALAKDPRARFRSGRDFERALTDYLRERVHASGRMW